MTYPQPHQVAPPRPRWRPCPARVQLPRASRPAENGLRSVRGSGFCPSLLAYELPDGRLELIDGHLRRDLDPDMEVEVEILDVNDTEARRLLLSSDPLAALAENQEQLQRRLLELTPTVNPELREMWERAAANAVGPPPKPSGRDLEVGREQYYVLSPVATTCTNGNCWHASELRDWNARRSSVEPDSDGRPSEPSGPLTVSELKRNGQRWPWIAERK